MRSREFPAAVKKGVLDFYPFLDYSYERPKGEPRSITQEELERIIDHSCSDL